MNTQNTVEQLKGLKLTGMAKRYEAALSLPVHELQDVHGLIAIITQAEVEYREHARTQSILKPASSATMLCPKIYSVMPNEGSPENRYSGFRMACL